LEGRIFQPSIRQDEQVEGGVMGGLPREEWYLVFFPGRNEENECVKEEIVLMCEKVLFMGKMCANKEHGRKLCVTNSCSGIHGRISMNKPLDFYFK
jgi:hypothetical protein